MRRESLGACLGILNAAAAWLGPGCSATSEPATGDLAKDLRHADPRVRMVSAYRAAAEKREDLLEILVENLSDPDESVRFVTAIALKRMTGQDFGYRSFAGWDERAQAAARWRAWLQGSRPPGDGPEDVEPDATAARAGGGKGGG